jgi:LPXTG-motif cell wall-anchored protein
LHLLSRLLTLAVAGLLAVALAVPAFAQDGTANLRVGHLSVDAPNVDVYLNDEPVAELQGVPYGTISPYLPVPAGTQNVKVYAAGDTSEPVIEADVDLAAGADYTVGAVGLVEDGSLTAQVYEDDNSAPEPGNGHLRVIHASPDAGPVDVGPQGGDNLVEGLEFPNASDYAPVPAGTYTIDVKAAGTDEAALSVPDVTVADGVVYTAFAVGLAGDGSLEVILTEDSAAMADEIPHTGGFSPALLVGGSALLAAAFGGLLVLRRRSEA